MRVAIMQPYFIPYLGYFQLLQSCDLFAYYIDVQFPNRSWINRNRLMNNNEPVFCTVPLKYHSVNTQIRDIEIAAEFEKFRKRTLSIFDHNYSRAPSKGVARELLESVLAPNESNLVAFLVEGLSQIYSALSIERPIISSTQLEIDPKLSGQDRIVAIVQAVGGDSYVNLPGGRSLYEPQVFDAAGIKLQFLDPYVPIYETTSGGVFPRMSVIDTLAYLGVEDVKKLLTEPRITSEF